MGQHPSKVHRSQSATKPSTPLNRVSKLFQPGSKREQRATSSNRSSPQPTKVEDAATHIPVADKPEAESRPAEVADHQV